jgi:DNA-binding MarR family transcriptional regulator
MKVDKVLTRLAGAPDDVRELRRVARALGSELPRQRIDVLRQFRAGLAQQPVSAGSLGSFARGYVNGLTDVTAEYEVSLRQVAEEAEIGRLALRRDWREVLMQLGDGPKLPSDIATSLQKDRPTVTRILKKLRAAGLVHAYSHEEVDGRTRPHRLTVHGQRVLDGLDAGISADVERGIRLGVALFRQITSRASCSQAELDTVVRAILDDPGAAAAAASLWGSEARTAGLVTEFDGEYRLAPLNGGPVNGRNEILWSHGTDLLARLKERRSPHIPVFVRTTNEAWGAWAYALQDDTTGLSRTIVNGDIVSRTIEPPPRFDLLYDDPAVIGADRHIPAMQTLMAQADAKFVITTGEDPVPDGFVQLEIYPDPDKD